MNKAVEESKRLALMLSKARNDSGVSQEYMAMSLHVSRSTIQAWEKGTSSPTMIQTFRWFDTIGVNPMRPFLEYVYPDTYGKLKPDDDDDKVLEALHCIIDNIPSIEQRQVANIFYAEHGSSPAALLQLFTAYLHLPLKYRAIVSQQILALYEICEECDELICKDAVQSDISLLKNSIHQGRRAAIEGKHGYVSQLPD